MTSKQLEDIAKRQGYISITRDENNKVVKLVRIKGGKIITHTATREKQKKQLKREGK